MDETIGAEMLALLPRLRRFAHGLTGKSEEAEELVQATCERAIRHIALWQPGTRLDHWMFAIARNLNLNNLRARKVRGAHLAPVALDDHLSIDGVRAAESRSTFTAVQGFVGRLPEEQRSALLLNCVEGLSYKEVAEVLDLPVGTVTSRIARARIALRDYVNGSETAALPEKPGAAS